MTIYREVKRINSNAKRYFVISFSHLCGVSKPLNLCKFWQGTHSHSTKLRKTIFHCQITDLCDKQNLVHDEANYLRPRVSILTLFNVVGVGFCGIKENIVQNDNKEDNFMCFFVIIESMGSDTRTINKREYALPFILIILVLALGVKR